MTDANNWWLFGVTRVLRISEAEVNLCVTRLRIAWFTLPNMGAWIFCSNHDWAAAMNSAWLSVIGSRSFRHYLWPRLATIFFTVKTGLIWYILCTVYVISWRLAKQILKLRLDWCRCMPFTIGQMCLSACLNQSVADPCIRPSVSFCFLIAFQSKLWLELWLTPKSSSIVSLNVAENH